MDLDTLSWIKSLPKEILDVTDKINEIGRALIVGGFVRDSLLHISSYDIDIEVYDQPHLDTVEAALSPFGPIHSVGKSFGVLIFTYGKFHFDVTLARKENKVGIGHKGFSITTAPFERFETIALRRDFTINAMGYDTKEDIFLDPFNGTEDLLLKILRPVDTSRFNEDPLRVLRAIGFISRFELQASSDLVQLSTQLVKEDKIQELPAERIFSELDKWLLKSSRPALGYQFLKDIGLLLFPHLQNYLRTHKDQAVLLFNALEKAPKRSILRWSLLFIFLPLERALEDLQTVSQEKKLIAVITQYHTTYYALMQLCQEADEAIKLFNLKLLARKIPLKDLQLFVAPLEPQTAMWLEKSAKEHKIWDKAIDPLLKGEDLLQHGLVPSPKFKELLEKAYLLQLNNDALSKETLLQSILS